MTEFSDDHKVNLTAGMGQGGAAGSVVPETPFSILVLGDFSGRGIGAEAKKALDWRPVRVTPDNLPALAGLETRLTIRLPGVESESTLEFDSLMSFHPDRLCQSLPHLQALSAERARVAAGGRLSESYTTNDEGVASTEDPGGSEEPDVGPGSPAEADEESGTSSGPSAAASGGLLDAIVDRSADKAASVEATGQTDAELQAFVREIVRPHIVSETRVEASDLEVVDDLIAAALREVLRNEDLMGLEALWRSLLFLLSRIDTDVKTRVYIVDVSREELEAEATGQAAALLRLLSEPGLGPAVPRWGCVVGAYDFGTGPDDIRLLAEIGAIAATVDLPWVSEALPECVGSPGWDALEDPEAWSSELGNLWDLLRDSEGSEFVGLVMPGFLTREHYGDDGLRCKVHSFHEAPRGPDDLVWGNSAFLWAALLGRSFADKGWSFAGNPAISLGQLAVVPTPDEEAGVLGPTRAVLPLSGAERISKSGIMPLLGLPHEAGVRLGGLHSLHVQRGPLRAWWEPRG